MPSEAVESLAGVGPKSAPLYREVGIESVGALLDYLPYRYEDLRFATPAAQLLASDGEVNAVGEIVAVKERRLRGLEIVEVRLRDDAGEAFGAKWIGRNRYVYGRFQAGMRLFVRGRVERTLAGPVVAVTQYAQLAPGQNYRGELIPVYRASKALASRKIAAVVKKNMARLLAAAPPDPLPPAVVARRGFASIDAAYRSVHLPETPGEAVAARERLIFGEFFGMAAAAALRRSEREHDTDAPRVRIPEGYLERFAAQLPFALTAAQRTVIAEIWEDMTRAHPMNRLLQGDVGSGKTVVAAAAIALAAHNGIQSALMAPTELLAAQHAAKLAPLLLPFGIALEAVFGSQGARARAAALDRIASGEASVAVGTHALLTEAVAFARLGLTVIDEQHRFGVAHRARLRSKGAAPHTLHMTATPIPRTLAQSVYADLDVSTIDGLPPGRTPVATFAVRVGMLDRVYAFARALIERGRQVYVVAPAIEEGETALTSAIAEAERVRAEVFGELRVGLLHGRLAGREKESTMQAFARGELDVLVATTVIEVGVDVPNASLMIVLDAHRYGLAQLHQLRGRVGRGAATSYCVLVYPDEAGETERLETLTRTNDGFEIAETDLRLRGAGQFSGTQQAGRTELLFGDLARDAALYREARRDAEAVVAADPTLAEPGHAGLRAHLTRRANPAKLLLSS